MSVWAALLLLVLVFAAYVAMVAFHGWSALVRLARYNSRHHLYRHPERGLHLNPISSTYDGRQWSVHEPLWAFRLRQRWFAHAGRQRCGRRGDPFSFNRNDGAAPDTWDWGPDGNRTCSYCGSIHFDDLMKICALVEDDPRYGVEGTDKSYKVYVKQPDVRNASEGAIKFYMHHAPEHPTLDQKNTYARAIRITTERFRARMARHRG